MPGTSRRPAAHAELAVFVDRIFRREAGEREAIAQFLRRDLGAGRDHEAGGGEAVRRAQSRHQRAGRGHDQTRVALTPSRAAHGRERTRLRGAASGRDTDRLPGTAAAARE
jgi:hypothetical protein